MILVCVALIVGFNLATDPFGVFGDKVLDWYAYDMTMNPRVAKVAYLDQHYGEYDSYVIGSSKASSLSVDLLNEYMDASFYSMTWDDADLKDEGQMVRYLLENYSVKNIILTVEPQCAALYDEELDSIQSNMHCKVDGTSALAFYGKYLFANPVYGAEKLTSRWNRSYLITADEVYIPKTGCYNMQRRDASPIGDTAEYLALENNLLEKVPTQLPYREEAIDEIAAIKELCDVKDVNLMIIGLPVNTDEFYCYDQAQFSQFWRELAQITDFYEFWGNNSVNGDIRYFYDTDHFRNMVGSMALAYIFGNKDQYIPENFGHRTTGENVEQRIAEAYSDLTPVDPASYTCNVPILMYHAFTDDPANRNDLTVYVEDFRAQLEALRAAGYESVTYQDLIDYVDHGTPLPEKPILITIDDGYRNNLALAAPVLDSCGFSATIAVIGCSVGKGTYKDTEEPTTPHFALEDAAEYVARGVLDIQPHSYDMHQVARLDGEDCRRGVLQKDGEDEDAYIEALTADFLKSKEQIESMLPVTCQVYTYPYGLLTELSEVVLHSLGLRVTVTTEYGVNQIIKGVPQSLYQLKRIAVGGFQSVDEILPQIEQQLEILTQ